MSTIDDNCRALFDICTLKCRSTACIHTYGSQFQPILGSMGDTLGLATGTLPGTIYDSLAFARCVAEDVFILCVCALETTPSWILQFTVILYCPA